MCSMALPHVPGVCKSMLDVSESYSFLSHTKVLQLFSRLT